MFLFIASINKKLLYFHTIIKNKIVIVSINKKTNKPTLFKQKNEQQKIKCVHFML
jgi:hypothetical protein